MQTRKQDRAQGATGALRQTRGCPVPGAGARFQQEREPASARGGHACSGVCGPRGEAGPPHAPRPARTAPRGRGRTASQARLPPTIPARLPPRKLQGSGPGRRLQLVPEKCET